MLSNFDFGSFLFGITMSWALLLLILMIAVVTRGDKR